MSDPRRVGDLMVRDDGGNGELYRQVLGVRRPKAALVNQKLVEDYVRGLTADQLAAAHGLDQDGVRSELLRALRARGCSEGALKVQPLHLDRRAP